MDLVPRMVKRKENNNMMQRITIEELKSVVEDIEEDKALCPGGFNERFIKVCWEIVQKD